MNVLWGLGGMCVLLALAVLLSTDRRAIKLRTVGAALALQLGFGVVVLYWSTGQYALEQASKGVQAVIDSSSAGIEFVFGQLAKDETGTGRIRCRRRRLGRRARCRLAGSRGRRRRRLGLRFGRRRDTALLALDLNRIGPAVRKALSNGVAFDATAAFQA